ncbi:cyclin-L2 [Polychaeton citri CBS 116435]|uniref:Cyclin-L2 n=1 Tax=Polychaeton citri CBS 116435 TaxID=1314669 RepID=A0A9P4QHQ3_9PEZI|nr:cyclin-L2 [Polychaeton citri CBS 116435]
MISDCSHLANPLASPGQLETSASQIDGLPQDLEDVVRYQTFRLTQVAGILLRLPQEIIAQSIVILQRFLIGTSEGSLLQHDAIDIAAAALFLTAKPSATPVSSRSVLTVCECLLATGVTFDSSMVDIGALDLEWYMSEGTYEARRSRLYALEAAILRKLGFRTHCALPHALCINYLQTMDAFRTTEGPSLAVRAFKYLNTALLSPQLLYLTHQPPVLATASIYLAAKEVGAKLPEVEWWEVFDVDREELGFLVVALQSVENFAAARKDQWNGRKVPLTADELQSMAEDRQTDHFA